jgi:hypothetical protein
VGLHEGAFEGGDEGGGGAGDGGGVGERFGGGAKGASGAKKGKISSRNSWLRPKGEATTKDTNYKGKRQ